MKPAALSFGLASDALATIADLHEVSPDFAAAWDDLSANASEPNPFYERWFLAPAMKHLQPGSPSLLAVRDGHRLIGLFPIVRARRYGRIPVPHVQNWLHYHCFYGAPLIRRGCEAPFWAAALAALDAAPRLGAFLHLSGLDPTTTAFRALGETRRTDVVYRSVRALLASNQSPQDYYTQAVRKKKRKEFGRLRSRLSESGLVSAVRLATSDDASPWIADFLALEAAGWKGRKETALALDTHTHAFFQEAMLAGHAAARIEMTRLTVGGQTIAMSVNLIDRSGSYAFKIAFDEAFARYSPGVLLQIEMFDVMERTDWMDSCAVEDHVMINSLWRERRSIVRVTIPLRGRGLAFTAARSLERGAAFIAGRPC